MGTKRIYPEHEQAIYLWKLKDDGSIEKHVITEYRKTTYGYTLSIQYMFKIGKETTPRCIKDVQLDRFLNGRVCSFDGDDNKAKQIIEETLMARANKFKEDYNNTMNLLNAMRGHC